jgi:hypothetical protein
MKKRNQKDSSSFGKFSPNVLNETQMKTVSGGANLVEYILLVGVVALV